MDVAKIINHWMESSDRDFTVMEHLFEKSYFTWSLFIGHIVLEKLLKAYYVSKKHEHPPFTHNLLTLAEKSGLTLDSEAKDVLITVTRFNIVARYEDVKLTFHKKCTPDFTGLWINKIKEFRKWIKKKLLK